MNTLCSWHSAGNHKNGASHFDAEKKPWMNVRILATAQHGLMLDQISYFFGIDPDIYLNIMRPDQTLTTLTVRLLPDVVKLVGSNYESIVVEAQRLLNDESTYSAMAGGVSHYGDGHAAERIVKTLREHFA